MALGLSHGGSNVYSSSQPSNELLVGTKQGVAILERSGPGASWRDADRVLPDLHISSIVFEPESGTIFAGAFFDWVYASTDGGRTWERRSTGMSVNDIYSLGVTRLNGRPRIYAGTQPAHLFYSDDLGQSWQEMPSLRNVETVQDWSFPAPPHIAHTKFITFDPVDPTTIYACIEQGALLKSTDNGASWREINSMGFFKDEHRAMDSFYDVHKALVDPRNPQRILVTGGAGFYVTPDGGSHWERRMSPDWAQDVYPDGFVMRPQQPDTILVSAAEHNPSRWMDAGKPGYAGGRIFRSADGGQSWERLRNGLPESMRHEFGALCLEESPAGCAVYAATTGGEVYASEDAGDHWSLIADEVGAVSKKGHERIVAVA
jgi:photosystem II stability/assembly factor-like uncharacterized protein